MKNLNLSTEIQSPEVIPYFLWDEPMNVAQLKERLRGASHKLCALLGRAEIRDLVDVRALELSGYSVESALPAAAAKDVGLTPGQLSWVLSQIILGDDLIPPGGISVQELRKYLNDLVARLSRLAFPKNP